MNVVPPPMVSISPRSLHSLHGTQPFVASVRSHEGTLVLTPRPPQRPQAAAQAAAALPAATAAACATALVGRWRARAAVARPQRRSRRQSGKPSVCCAATGQTPPSAWHSASSRSSDPDSAVQEVVARWRASVEQHIEDLDFPSFSSAEQCIVTEGSGTLPSDADLPPFSVISTLWKAWRAGEFGKVPFHEAVEKQATAFRIPKLVEALDLFPDDADVVYPGWREQLIWGTLRPNEENWKKGVRRGSSASTLRRSARELRRRRGQGEAPDQGEVSGNGAKLKPGFAILFVPQRFASRLDTIAFEVERSIGWPGCSTDAASIRSDATGGSSSSSGSSLGPAPLIAILSDGESLQLGTAFLRCKASPPTAVFLGQRELEEAGSEGFRLQESLLNGLAKGAYTDYYRKYGRTNGTVVACRSMWERGPADVGSVLVFADPATPAELPCKALGLLDSCYPNAVNCGVVAASCESAPGHSLFLGGRRGRLRQAGVICLLLPGAADSAIGLCGCEAFGPMWEVFDADLRPGAAAIRMVSDPASRDLDDEGRRKALPAGLAFQAAALDAANADAEDRALAGDGPSSTLSSPSWWVGAPRVPLRKARDRAPGVGEWALFRGKTVTVEGSLLLEGPGPAAEGVSNKDQRGGQLLTRVQGFRTRGDYAALGRLQRSYEMDRLMGAGPQEARHGGWKPYATLVFGGGDGPKASIADESLHDGVCFGAAVLGAPGNSLSEVPTEDSLRDCSLAGPPPQRATLVHRQACALVMLYA